MAAKKRTTVSRRPAASSPARIRVVRTPADDPYAGPSVLFGTNTSGANLSALTQAIADLALLKDRGIGGGKIETVYQGTARELESAISFVEGAIKGTAEAIGVIGELVANVGAGQLDEGTRVGAGWAVSGLAAVLGELQAGRQALAVARPLESAEVRTRAPGG